MWLWCMTRGRAVVASSRGRSCCNRPYCQSIKASDAGCLARCAELLRFEGRMLCCRGDGRNIVVPWYNLARDETSHVVVTVWSTDSTFSFKNSLCRVYGTNLFTILDARLCTVTLGLAPVERKPARVT